MARLSARPGRTLAVFFLCVGVVYALVALAGTWKPALGLDLQGGTRITLITTVKRDAPRAWTRPPIIDQRVNGSGVYEAEVTTQGNKFIVVEIPGQSRRDLVDTVKRQAQLRFRLVASRRPARPRAAVPAPRRPRGSPAPGVTPVGRQAEQSDRRATQPATRPARRAARRQQPPGRRKAPTRPRRRPRPTAQLSATAGPTDGEPERRRPTTPADQSTTR